MRRTSKTPAALLAAAALVLTALAGCSASPSQPSETVSLTWWGWNSVGKDQVIHEFETQNPGIKVTYKNFDYTNYLTALRPGLSSSDGPDVFQLQPGDLVGTFGPLAVPVDTHIAKDAGSDWASKFNQAGLDQLKLNGKQVALPSYMSAAGLVYYNKTILDKYGLSVPKDFSEWKKVCQVLRANNVGCLAQGAKDAWVNTDVFLSLINSIAPGKVYEAISGKTSWTGVSFKQAMDAWSELFTSGIIAPGATAASEYPDAQTTFLENKAAFIALGTWNTPATMTKTGQAQIQETVTAKIDGLFRSAPFPAPIAGGTPTQLFGGPDNGYSVSAKSQKQDAAFKLLEFLTVGDGQNIQAAAGNIPAIQSIKVSTSDIVDPSQVADIEAQQAGVSQLVGLRQIPYSDLSAAIGQALSGVAAGTTSPADALTQIQTASDKTKR
jgi:raffinose/stachyose/melibiose transport system substrate-binding protein